MFCKIKSLTLCVQLNQNRQKTAEEKRTDQRNQFFQIQTTASGSLSLRANHSTARPNYKSKGKHQIIFNKGTNRQSTGVGHLQALCTDIFEFG